MNDALSVSVLSTERVCVLSVQGVLDWATADEFDEVAAKALGTQPSLLVLDLRSLTFLDFTGAESVSITCESVVANGGRTAVVNVPASALRVLRLVGLTASFPVHRIDGLQSVRSVLGAAGSSEPLVARALAAPAGGKPNAGC